MLYCSAVTEGGFITDDRCANSSADEVIKRLGQVIRERTEEGNTVLVVGVGNTIGIA